MSKRRSRLKLSAFALQGPRHVPYLIVDADPSVRLKPRVKWEPISAPMAFKAQVVRCEDAQARFSELISLKVLREQAGANPDRRDGA
jgi:hypothetical protein